MSEFDLIDVFARRFRPAPSPRGPGDDAAVVSATGARWCVTTDAVVEGVHFKRPRFSLEDVGHKALAVNLSDLAAMGAKPRWFVCAVAMPRSYGRREVMALASGMSALARSTGIELIGGNFSAARELSVTITAAGQAKRPLLRSGGHSGDLLYVTGTLGDARLGLRRRAPRAAARRQRRPTPRLAAGLLAARYASAAIDLSDGLAQDLGHLCRASRLGATVDVDQLPVSTDLLHACKDRVGAAAMALKGGEDYELLLTVPPRRAAAFERACAQARQKVSQIGWLGGRQIRFLRGTHTVAVPAGYDHFGGILRI